jgi:hypothetical protein
LEAPSISASQSATCRAVSAQRLYVFARCSEHVNYGGRASANHTVAKNMHGGNRAMPGQSPFFVRPRRAKILTIANRIIDNSTNCIH